MTYLIIYIQIYVQRNNLQRQLKQKQHNNSLQINFNN